VFNWNLKMNASFVHIQNMKANLTFLFALFFLCLCSGQTLMERAYSPPGDHPLENVFQASDGGAWITMEYGKVLKVDENFNVEWVENYSILGSDRLIALQETSDGGAIVGGYEGFSLQTNNHIPILMRISPQGDVIWAKSFDLGYFGEIQSIIEPGNGDFMAVFNSTDGFSRLIFFDEEGMEFNFFAIKVNGNDVRTFGCQKLSDDGFVVGGDYYDENLDRHVFYIAEFDGQSPVWSKTYAYEIVAFPYYSFFMTSTANGDIGVSSQIGSLPSQQTRELILLSVDESGELIWGKKMEPDVELTFAFTTGLVSDGGNGIYQSFAYWSQNDEMVTHFSGWNESGENLFIQTVTKPTANERFGYEYRTDEGLFVLSGEDLEIGTQAESPVLTLQGPQGEMPCDQSSETVLITDLLPEVSDVTIELEDSEGGITDLEVSKATFGVASYLLCSATLNTTNLEDDHLLEIYPNPSDHAVFFDIGDLAAETLLIQIFDQLGREVYSRNGVRGSLFTISKESIGSGLFVARISHSDTGEVLGQGKFVVE
jgi:hypothetical protein